MDNIISRPEAIAQGLNRYFTGKPCVNGHVCERSVHNFSCYECIRIRERRTRAVWREKNRDHLRSYFAKYYAANKAAQKVRQKRWDEKNPEALKIKKTNRRAREVMAIGSHDAADIRYLFAAQRGKCPYCKKTLRSGYHIDHIMPLVLGGSNNRSNLQLTCSSCNLSKGGKHPASYAKCIGLLL